MPVCEIRQPFANTIIRASAGTGKTYQLANRFLALMHAGERPDHILAATFARKAAGEILDRVLLRLAEAVDNDITLAELSAEMHTHVPGIVFDRTRCLLLLQALVRNLHRLRIGTLDSFFAQLGGSFGLELGLPPGWSIVDEVSDQAIREAAVRDVLDDGPVQDTVTLMHLLSKGNVGRAISWQIRDVTNSLYGIYRGSNPITWHTLKPPPPLKAEAVAAAIEHLDALPRPTQKSFAKAIEKDLAQLREEDWEEFVSSGVGASVLSNGEKYGSMKIPGEILEIYHTLVRQAKAVIMDRIKKQTEATWTLLHKFHAAYERRQRERRALRFDDITHLLSSHVADIGVNRLSYRLDAHLCQVLLDEFQDTSLNQWRVMQPFAHAAATEDKRSLFCVGDVKQAIYGWRGGESRLLEEVEDGLPHVDRLPLNESYRSSQVVIDTVNQVFGTLHQNAALDDQPDVKDFWRERFETHTTAKNLAGYVSLEQVAMDPDEEDTADVVLQHAAEEIARLHQAAPGKSVGVLVRRNQTVGRLMFLLREWHGVQGSEEGGNPLVDSSAVNLVLSLMTLADHPGDTIARFHVATSPLGGVMGYEKWRDGPAARLLSQRIRQSLLQHGYGKTIDGWTRKFADHCDPRELTRLTQLVEMAYGYDGQATLRPDDFVKYVKTTKVDDPTAADVRVMTVHQAKGLQFDIVVLPELDFPLTSNPGKVLIGRESPTGPVTMVSRYVNQKLLPLFPNDFAEIGRAQNARHVDESLCLLYVAMTRAVHALHLYIADPKAARSYNSSFSSVLRKALAEESPADDPNLLYRHGDPQWFKTEAAQRNGASPDSPSATPARPVERLEVRFAAPHGRRLERRSPSSLEGGSSVDLARRWREDSTYGTSRGSVWHAWFEQIAWWEDGIPSDDVLREAAVAFPEPGLNIENEIEQFRETVGHSVVRACLSRDAYADPYSLGWPEEVCDLCESGAADFEVCRERNFAVRDDATLLNGAIDRLVLVRDGDRVVAADIIDFKTDAVDEYDLFAWKDKVEYYRPQQDAYRRAVCLFCHLPPQAVSVRLLFTGPKRLFPIPIG